MKKRVYSSVLIVVVLALLFVLKAYVSDYFFDVFFCALACYASYEMSKLLSKIGCFNYQWIATAFPAFLLAGNLLGVHFSSKTGDFYWILYTILIDFVLVVLGFLVSFLVSICRKKSKIINEITVRKLNNISIYKFSLKKALYTSISFVYPAFIFLFFVFINHINALPFDKLEGVATNLSIFALLTAFLIPIFTDTFAMLTGSVIGGKKLCPKISPNKTISGAVGGVLWCMLFCACLYLVFGCVSSFQPVMQIFPVWAYLMVVFLGSILAQCGDLFESIIKRRAGVSDSGKFLPGHGGLLDRIDSHIFMAPYIFLVLALFLI